MNRQDQISSLFWLLIGLLIIIGTLSSLKIGTANDPGPGLYPLLAGICLSIFSLLILFKATLAKTWGRRSLTKLWEGLNWPKVIYTIGALLVYTILLEVIGFLLMTLLLFIFLFRIIKAQKWKLTIGLSLFTSIGSYLIFNRILQVELPRGILGF